MAVTSGFFNSLNYDRLYNSEQMSEIFDGVIEDGVYSNIYNQFKVTANEGMTIQVDTGRSWFNHAWTKNDSILLLDVPTSEILFDRIDAVVIRVDHTEAVRSADIIEIVKGTPSAEPQRPNLANGPDVYQHVLAYIYVAAESTEITQADITNMVGTSECPFVVGAAKSMDIDFIVDQWESQWKRWFNTTTTDGKHDLDTFLNNSEYEFNVWFESLKDMLDEETAARLANEILELKDRFKILAKEYSVYDTIDDQDGNPILDNNGLEIEGNIVYMIKNKRGCRL